jgi:hypothetical protein
MDVALDNQGAAQTSYTGEQTAAFAAKLASSARINQYSYAYGYDNAGSLTADGTTTYAYDALSRITARGSTTYTYKGDGTLVKQIAGGGTMRGDQSPR